MGVSHKGYQPITAWHDVWAVEKADRTELGFFTGHFPIREGFAAVTLISEPFFPVMLNTELIFLGGHALVGRVYLGANAVSKVEVMVLEVQVEMGSWEKLRIVGMW